jgi:ribosomal protein L11 methyltransferase
LNGRDPVQAAPDSAPGPGDWLVLSMAAPPAGEALYLVDALRSIGARAVEREGDRVRALFPAPVDVAATVAAARQVIRTATAVRRPDLDWSWQSRDEWATRWRAEHPPRRVGRFLVVPSGTDREQNDADHLLLRLEPGAAFGTAEHATTRACLHLLDGAVQPGDTVLDLGTGSGILAIGAALLGAAGVLAVDADPLACEAARGNVDVNGVGSRVRVRELEVGPRDLRALGRHDVVTANLEAGILRSLVPALPAALRRDGCVIASGVVGSERDGVRAAAEEAGLSVVEEVAERGWWSALLAAGVE